MNRTSTARWPRSPSSRPRAGSSLTCPSSRCEGRWEH